ncbi:MAG: 50S ribosomal protein L21e [Candidatus Micrarchaeota archaeon]
MVKRSKGFFSKRTKSTKMKKKITVNEFVKPFTNGETVILKITSYFKGIPHPRYNGRCGEIIGKQGSSYLIKITDGQAKKVLAVNPAHIIKVNG